MRKHSNLDITRDQQSDRRHEQITMKQRGRCRGFLCILVQVTVVDLFFFFSSDLRKNGLLQVQARNACKQAWIGQLWAVSYASRRRACREGRCIAVRAGSAELTARTPHSDLHPPCIVLVAVMRLCSGAAVSPPCALHCARFDPAAHSPLSPVCCLSSTRPPCSARCSSSQ